MYVAQNLPVIPTTTASEWFEYDSQNYIGWPSQSNPYETGQPSGTNLGAGARDRRSGHPAPDIRGADPSISAT